MRRHGERTTERGAALSVTLLALLLFVALTVAMITSALSTKRDCDATTAHAQRRYLAEAGIADAVVSLTAGASGDVASATAPHAFGSGSYHVSVTDNGDGTFTVDSTGSVAGSSRRLRAVVRDVADGVFSHAMFAGNSGGDPTYALELGGLGAQADEIHGDLYSGGDVVVGGDAAASGTLRAGGAVIGATGEGGVSQPLPDIAGQHYEVNHDVDVAGEFATGGAVYVSNALGGTAWQLPEANAAHIFRLNPSDRGTEIAGTAKDDYFLEDPYETVRTGTAFDEASATWITIAGLAGEPGTSGNQLVYLVDGNLWLHNTSFYSLWLRHQDNEGVQVTFVVKGNVYFSDNLLIKNPQRDGVAFIAIRDPAVADSGNIYFGDAVYGTLERMDAFMYAENDFHDVNLSASGSARLEVNGIMSAGNQVAIERDHGASHTKLVLRYDDRVATGELALPGLPTVASTGTGRTIEVLSVFEVDAP